MFFLSILQGGADRYVVVLGDSNLNIDLPFGVQIIGISMIHIHDSYTPFSDYHDGDIGKKPEPVCF